MTTRDTALPSELSRDLTLFHVTMMGLGMMIGAGVFLGIGNAIHEAGPGGVLLTFGLNGVIAIFTAMAYAELSSAVPRAGGAYNFARLAFGRGTSFLAGWMEWFASSIAGSLYAVTFSIYTLRYLRALGLLEWLPVSEPVAVRVVAAGSVGFFVYVNFRGASSAGKVGAVATLGQTIFLLFIGAVGIVTAVAEPSRLSNFEPFMPEGWSRLLVTMGFTYVAFEGFEVIAQAGDEVVEPRKNLPKAMLYSILIVTFTYVAVSFAAVVAVKAGDPALGGQAPWEWIGSFREVGFGQAVSRLRMMPAANLLLTLAVIFASTSALNATTFSATRAAYALGRDRMLPRVFSRVSQKRKTPWGALLFTTVIMLVCATALPTMDVASSASIMFLFLFLLVNVCVIVIRRNMGDELEYGFVMPLFPLLPVLAIIAQVALAAWLVHMSLIAWVVAPVWIVLGAVCYLVYSKNRAVATEDEIVTIEEEKEPAGEQYAIMVTVANPENALQLVRTTSKLCGAKGARVELLHMVPVPAALALAEADRYMLEGREAIVETMLYLAHSFPVSTSLRYCRSVSRGIVSAVRERKVDLLVMGWRGAKRHGVFSLGSTVDPVIEQAPCDVVVLKDCGSGESRRILVPLAGGPNSAFALEVAGILAEDDQSEITAFTVGRRFDIDAFLRKYTRRDASTAGRRIATKTARPEDSPGAGEVIEAILDEAEGHDLIVIGSTGRRPLSSFMGATVPEAVAQRTTKPLAMVKAGGGIASWIGRWI